MTTFEGSEEGVCGCVVAGLHEELQCGIKDAGGKSVRLAVEASARSDEVAFEEIFVQGSRVRELCLLYGIDLVPRFARFEAHTEHVREGVLVRRQTFSSGAEEEVVRRDGVFEVKAFDVPVDDGVENGEIGSDACLLHVCDRSG